MLDKLDADKDLKGEAKDRIKDRMRYTLSGLYVENKDIDKAAKELETLIKRNPDNPTYKNDLGFIWCDHDMNLEESEKLITEALDLDKKGQEKLKEEGKIDEVKANAAYLDSLGWVLFKQKKYKEALEPLKKASQDEEEGSHLEIWDHLADCLHGARAEEGGGRRVGEGAEDGRPVEARRRAPPQGEREAPKARSRSSPRTRTRTWRAGERAGDLRARAGREGRSAPLRSALTVSRSFPMPPGWTRTDDRRQAGGRVRPARRASASRSSTSTTHPAKIPAATRLHRRLPRASCGASRRTAGRSWWVDRVCPEFDPTLTAERHLLDNVVPWVEARGSSARERSRSRASDGRAGGGAARVPAPEGFPSSPSIAGAFDFHELLRPRDAARRDVRQPRAVPGRTPPILHIHGARLAAARLVRVPAGERRGTAATTGCTRSSRRSASRTPRTSTRPAARSSSSARCSPSSVRPWTASRAG